MTTFVSPVTSDEYDIAIIGGGMAGASLACCLADQPLRIAIIEQVAANAQAQPSFDDRGLALSLSSRRILDAIGIWPDLASRAVPIRHIHISDQGRFGLVHLHAEQLQLDALGHVVIARELGEALLRKAATLTNTDIICPATVSSIKTGTQFTELDYLRNRQTHTLRCRLLVAADGTTSGVRDMLGIPVQVKDYGQTAIVSGVSTSLPHNYTAYERFTRQGPLAMLPMSQDRCVAVHIVATDRSGNYLQMADQQYLDSLYTEFGKRLGRFVSGGKRKSYPIRLVQADRQYAHRAVLLGNAAHTIHPNGAQGYNLGLRDTAALAEHISTAVSNGADPGNSSLLENYCRSRSSDQARVIRFTDMLAGLFYNNDPLKTCSRNLGMLLFDMSPALKRRFTLQATGLAGRQPALVKPLAGLP